jgi:hypothetical protein
MTPITFSLSRLLPYPAQAICAQVANVATWSTFKGYGMMPGIQNAEYETQTPGMVGSRIRVRNTDGSTHTEEIYRWVEGKEMAMKFCDFVPPLSQIATHFTEEWRLEPQGDGTLVTRNFQMFPRSALTRPSLWLISQLFRRAIFHQMEQMAGPGE